jgi:hypothetical protein
MHLRAKTLCPKRRHKLITDIKFIAVYCKSKEGVLNYALLLILVPNTDNHHSIIKVGPVDKVTAASNFI